MRSLELLYVNLLKKILNGNSKQFCLQSESGPCCGYKRNSRFQEDKLSVKFFSIKGQFEAVLISSSNQRDSQKAFYSIFPFYSEILLPPLIVKTTPIFLCSNHFPTCKQTKTNYILFNYSAQLHLKKKN